MMMKKIALIGLFLVFAATLTSYGILPAGNEEKATVNITKADFLKKIMNYEKNPTQWVFEGDKPCIVDFYADWCGPCKMVAPILEKLDKEYAGKVDIYKIDTEVEQELSSVFGIRSIPSMLFCPMDEQPQMSAGALPKPSLVQMINDILLKEKK